MKSHFLGYESDNKVVNCVLWCTKTVDNKVVN